MTWDQLQKKIADRYCGTVMVLDDEIYKRPAARKGKCTKLKSPAAHAREPYRITQLFSEAKTAFKQRGSLCDLWHIEDEFDSLAGCLPIMQAVSRSDIVVIDWYLGRGKDSTQDPSHAVSVLRHLNGCPGFRFAAIHSKEDPAQIVSRLRAEFGDDFADVSLGDVFEEEAEEVVHSENQGSGTPKEVNSPSTYRIGKSVYLCVLHKESTPSSAATLPDLFYSHLRKVFADHLHWIGFDFATRVRELLPVILGVLPTGTDIALAFQALVQGDNEMGDDIVECLCQEVQQLMRAERLASATDEAILERLISAAKSQDGNSDWASVQPPELKLACAVVTGGSLKADFKKYFHEKPKSTEDETKSQRAQKIVSAFIGKTLGSETPFEKQTALHEGYSALREQFQSGRPQRLYPGVILKRTPHSREGEEWLLCISPACDCARGDGEREYLFVGGKTTTSPETDGLTAIQTCISDEGRYVHLKWSSKLFKTRNSVPHKMEGYEFHSALRDDITSLFIHRVFGWQSRAGVNSSEYLRIMREKK